MTYDVGVVRLAALTPLGQALSPSLPRLMGSRASSRNVATSLRMKPY